MTEFVQTLLNLDIFFYECTQRKTYKHIGKRFFDLSVIAPFFSIYVSYQTNAVPRYVNDIMIDNKHSTNTTEQRKSHRSSAFRSRIRKYGRQMRQGGVLFLTFAGQLIKPLSIIYE